MRDLLSGKLSAADQREHERTGRAIADALDEGGQARSDELIARDDGPKDVRGTIFVFEPLPDPLARLTQRIKHAFDPVGVLNPGRMYHFS